MAKIVVLVTASARQTLSAAEQQGVQWLVERCRWDEEVYVYARTDREFDLKLSGSYPISGSTVKGRFDCWFVRKCVQEWVHMRLLDQRVKNVVATGQPNVLWRYFEEALAAERAKLAAAPTKLVISDTLVSAVHETWEYISPDAEVENNAEAIELVLDADRIAMCGNKAAYEELNRLDKQFGYEKVSEAIAKRVQLV